MSEICLFLSNDGSIEDHVIDWYTNCDWAHCGWLRRSDMWTYSAQHDGGLIWRPPNPKAKILKLSADGMDASLAKALTAEGSAYDMLNILGIALSKDWSTPGETICDKALFWFQDQVRLWATQSHIYSLHSFEAAGHSIEPVCNGNQSLSHDVIPRDLRMSRRAGCRPCDRLGMAKNTR